MHNFVACAVFRIIIMLGNIRLISKQIQQDSAGFPSIGPFPELLFQRWVNSVLKGHCPVDLSSIPNQTYLNQLINVFRITIKLLAVEFLSRLELNSAGQWPSRTKVAHPCCRSFQHLLQTCILSTIMLPLPCLMAPAGRHLVLKHFYEHTTSHPMQFQSSILQCLCSLENASFFFFAVVKTNKWFRYTTPQSSPL